MLELRGHALVTSNRGSGTVYRRVLASGTASWIAHVTWQEGGKRRQAKRSYDTKKQAKAALTELLSHEGSAFENFHEVEQGLASGSVTDLFG
jgi:hypothetical protein